MEHSTEHDLPRDCDAAQLRAVSAFLTQLGNMVKPRYHVQMPQHWWSVRSLHVLQMGKAHVHTASHLLQAQLLR